MIKAILKMDGVLSFISGKIQWRCGIMGRPKWLALSVEFSIIMDLFCSVYETGNWRFGTHCELVLLRYLMLL